jgi:hypothetical protein
MSNVQHVECCEHRRVEVRRRVRVRHDRPRLAQLHRRNVHPTFNIAQHANSSSDLRHDMPDASTLSTCSTAQATTDEAVTAQQRRLVTAIIVHRWLPELVQHCWHSCTETALLRTVHCSDAKAAYSQWTASRPRHSCSTHSHTRYCGRACAAPHRCEHSEYSPTAAARVQTAVSTHSVCEAALSRALPRQSVYSSTLRCAALRCATDPADVEVDHSTVECTSTLTHSQ